MTKASIIILTNNRKQLLKQCLDSLIATGLSENEIILVDNGSSDGTSEMVKNYENLILVKNKKNLGVAKARNQGVKKAKGKFIIFLDDDTLIKKAKFSEIMDFMKKDSNVAIVGPKILYPDGKIQESARKFPTPLAVLWRGTFLARAFPNAHFYKDYILADFDHRMPKEVDWVMGACQVIRRETFDKIGFLDERYFFGYEDIDFCFRAKKAGFKVIYYPFAEIIHYYRRKSARSVLNRAKFEHLKSIARFFSRKYF